MKSLNLRWTLINSWQFSEQYFQESIHIDLELGIINSFPRVIELSISTAFATRQGLGVELPFSTESSFLPLSKDLYQQQTTTNNFSQTTRYAKLSTTYRTPSPLTYILARTTTSGKEQPHPTAIMSVVTLLDVKVLNNPAQFNAPYQFEITFESLENLSKDLEWKLTYVGSAQRCVSTSSLLYTDFVRYAVSAACLTLCCILSLYTSLAVDMTGLSFSTAVPDGKMVFGRSQMPPEDVC